MKLDASDLRYIDEEQWRVLRAVEQGSRNHQVVPTPLITQLAHLHHAGINKLIGALARRNLIARVQNAAYDGYRLTYGGLDFLALRTLVKNDAVHAVGQQIGVGKESDILIVSGPSLTDGEPEKRILKMHRLGRISFRNVKEKRDYLGKRKTSSWMYLSKLAAAKEIAFMQILYDHHFPVPRPFAQARHCIVMELIDAYPLRQIASIPANQLGPLYGALMKLIVRLARAGLIHGDFNEFNLLVREIHDDKINEEYEEGYGPDGPIPRVINVESHAQVQGIQPAKKESGGDESSDEDDDDLGEGIYIDEGVRVEPILIDFPQMMSVEHDNAKFFFDRDVACIQRFFRKRFRYTSSDPAPSFEEVVPPSRRVKEGANALRDEVPRRKQPQDASLGVQQPEQQRQEIAPSIFYQSGPASGAMAGEEDVASRFVLGVGDRREKGKGERMGRKKREDAEASDEEGEEENEDLEDVDEELEEDEDEDESEEEDDDDEDDEEEEVADNGNELNDGEPDEGDIDPTLGPRLRLDALVDATGYGNVSGTKKRRKAKDGASQDARALEEFMSQMRMQDPKERQQASDDENEDEEEEEEPDSQQNHLSARNRSDGKRSDITTRVAQERNKARNRDSKHHGAKSMGSRTGRRHAGGKAKGDSIRESAVF
ncbi:hypothetical protein CF327_g3346 [Tilletia walkeri]|uniref:Serine/threonine-protein kinase RIO2 n=1 Tax=Tilletia walkeri TaxID=117179 RepID=A0A8X7NDX8_9BASI|nr:hypothetical protein CF327_g3346 [Tilletia walkeri]KAE8271429.1 hypothetical protein A4X09_0g938 [Tilletia walkeri]